MFIKSQDSDTVINTKFIEKIDFKVHSEIHQKIKTDDEGDEVWNYDRGGEPVMEDYEVSTYYVVAYLASGQSVTILTTKEKNWFENYKSWMLSWLHKDLNND